MSATNPQTELDHLLIVEDDKGRKEIILKEASYSIGREQKCDVRLHSLFVSRRHATLLRKLRGDGSSYYQIADGDAKGKSSANGLLINGRKIERRLLHDLKHGDEIVFGPQVFAIYQLRRRDPNPTEPPDPYDITLIDPAMMLDDNNAL